MGWGKRKLWKNDVGGSKAKMWLDSSSILRNGYMDRKALLLIVVGVTTDPASSLYACHLLFTFPSFPFIISSRRSNRILWEKSFFFKKNPPALPVDMSVLLVPEKFLCLRCNPKRRVNLVQNFTIFGPLTYKSHCNFACNESEIMNSSHLKTDGKTIG